MKKFHRYAVGGLSFLFLMTVASCGGGSGGGGQSSESTSFNVIINSPSPENNAVLSYGTKLQIRFEKKFLDDGNYKITLYAEKDGASTMVAASLLLKEDATGNVTWSPDVELQENTAYRWNIEVSYQDEEEGLQTESSDLVFHVLTLDGVTAYSPQNGGVMDANLDDGAILSVKNAYSNSSASIEYDFEIFSDSGLTSLLASRYGVSQDLSEVYTMGILSSTASASGLTALKLTQNQEHYWRSRIIVNGVPSGWSGTFRFTPRNLCEIGGTRYASRVIEWKTIRECDDIIRANPSEALGSPNAGGFTDQAHPGWGFISIDFGGVLDIEMGTTVYNGVGSDIRVYEHVSIEPIELLAGLTAAGPWYSMGVRWCGDWCDFDLSTAGLEYARYLRIHSVDSPARSCFETPGPDIDSIFALNIPSSSEQCMQ